MLKQIVLIGLVGFVASLTTGCAATWKEKSAQWAPSEPAPALLAHYKITGPEQGLSILGAINAVQGKNPLAKIGEQTVPVIKAGFAGMSMNLFVDKARAHKIDESQTLIKVDVSDNVKAVGTALGNLAQASDGDWQHPDTSRQPFHLTGTLLKGSFFKHIAKAVSGDNASEVYVSMGITLKEASSWGVMHGCELQLMVRALDANGAPVFQAKAIGESGKSFFGSYITEGTVRDALTHAMAQLQGVEWGVL
jgi:hypothetical protein